MGVILTFDDGMLLVATDLHGNLHDFQRVLHRFDGLRQRYPGLKLVLMGDLIHGYNPKTDDSLDIVRQLMLLGANQPDSPYIYMLGNHELVHIYHWGLMRGNWDFAKGFEWKIANCRQSIIDFFHQLPIAIATKGGVLLHHTGASVCYSRPYFNETGLPQTFWHSMDHQAIKILTNKYYGDGSLSNLMGKELMLRAEGKAIWEAWMNGNEHQYGLPLYNTYQCDMLAYFSSAISIDLNLMVTGHITVPTGIETVGERQVRLCSSQGCTDDLQKKMLLINAAYRYTNADELAMHVEEVY